MIRSFRAPARLSLNRPSPFTPRNRISGTPSFSEAGRLQTSSPLRILRRQHTSKHGSGQTTSDETVTIPGPSWLWLDPIYEPFRAYGRVQQRRPYMTQFISSLVIYFVGDLVAQSLVEPAIKQVAADDEEEKGWVQAWGENRDWARTGRALAIGGLSSIPAYKWFLWLGNNFNYGSKILSLTTKVVVNQALFTPLFNSYFFGMQSLLSGATVPEIIERIKNTVPTSWINSCKVWPIVTAFSFTYIPIQYRSIFGGVIAIGWQTYLSLLNQRAAAVELAEQEAGIEGGHVEVVRARVVEECDEDDEKCAA